MHPTTSPERNFTGSKRSVVVPIVQAADSGRPSPALQAGSIFAQKPPRPHQHVKRSEPARQGARSCGRFPSGSSRGATCGAAPAPIPSRKRKRKTAPRAALPRWDRRCPRIAHTPVPPAPVPHGSWQSLHVQLLRQGSPEQVVRQMEPQQKNTRVDSIFAAIRVARAQSTSWAVANFRDVTAPIPAAPINVSRAVDAQHHERIFDRKGARRPLSADFNGHQPARQILKVDGSPENIAASARCEIQREFSAGAIGTKYWPGAIPSSPA